MGRVISVVNQKGGVGKTTTAVNLGAYLASYGKFVLLIDIDPQANASSSLGIDHQKLEKGVYESLLKMVPVKEIIKPSEIEGLSVLPSTLSLAGANVEFINISRREFRLADLILEIRNDYDYILIDCPPSLGILTVNGLVASQEVLVPVQCEYFALEGLGQLLNTINLVRDNLKPELDILGVVLTMYDDRYRLTQEVMEEVYRYFPKKIFRTVIPRNVKLAEAPSFGIPISLHDATSRGGRAYERLARELLETEEKFEKIIEGGNL